MKFSIEGDGENVHVGVGAKTDWTGWRVYDKASGEEITYVTGFDSETGTVTRIDALWKRDGKGDEPTTYPEKRTFRVMDTYASGVLIAETMP